MRITFQPSSGRGEYELSEYAPSGESPNDLLEISIRLLIGEFVLYTGVKVTKDQGKYRLRVDPKGAHPQIPTQLADALLMPPSIREESKMGGGELVLQNNSYIVKNIQFGNVTYNPSDPFFTAEVSTIDCKNQTIEAEQIPVLKRIAEIKKIWEQRTFFPLDIANLLNQHEAYVRAKSPIPKAAHSLVVQLQRLMQQYSSELEIPYTSTTDVIPALLSALGEVVEEMPTSLEQIEPEQIELRRRERIKWQVWARRRGAASVRFRKEIRTAYNQRCVMCGGRFPASSYNEKPGIDAAHILPWAEYDLDKVYNGVALCKLHHWAFDEGILLIVFRDGNYYTELSEGAVSVLGEPDFSIDILRQVVGEVPKKYLPSKPADWPNPGLLTYRNEEFAS